MASFSKFNATVADWTNKVHNMGADVFKIMLSNTAPVATNAVKADITEIAAGNGYTAGGNTVAATANSQTSGTDKFTGNAVTFTAATGAMATFRYLVLYNSTTASGNLIGWYDYGSALTLNVGDALTIGKDTAGGNWDSTTPILTLQ